MTNEAADQTPDRALGNYTFSLAVPSIQPLTQRSMFWRPIYLEPSAWQEHIPFAFWLIEAHRPRVLVELGSHHGVSYFAFCQAVEKLGLDTRCFAVDTWKGDEHAGFYDESVFEKVKAHNETQYSGFSRLVRSTFDDALSYFIDGSIDLLHIDGLHTLEAVRHDFETWLPKLSERAVVVMHDTNVRERGFGVFMFFEELQRQHPTFEFVHGHGLGIVGVGVDQKDLLQRLFRGAGSELVTRAVQEVFSRLGRACADTFNASQQQERAHNLKKEIDKQRKQIDELKQSLEKAKADLGTRSKELADVRVKLNAHKELQAVERGQLSERANLLQEIRTELKEELIRQQKRVDEISTQLNVKVKELEQLEQTNSEHQQQLKAATDKLHSKDKEILSLKNELSQEQVASEALRVEKLAESKIWLAKLEQVQALLEQREAELTQSANHLKQINNQFHERDDQLTRLKLAFEAHVAETSRSEADLKDLVVSRENEINELRSSLATITSHISAITEENAALRSSLQEQTAKAEAHEARLQSETAKLNEISELRSSLATATSQVSVITEENAALRSSLQEQIAKAEAHEARLQSETAKLNEINELRSSLATTTSHVSAITEENAALRSSLQEQIAKAEAHEARLQSETARLNAAVHCKTELKDKIRKFEQTNKTLNKNIEDRFRELASLTKLLEDRDSVLANNNQKIKQIIQEKEALALEQARVMEMLKRAEQEAKKLKQQLEERTKRFETLQTEKETESSKFKAEINSSTIEKQKLTLCIQDRFRELAELTKMLERGERELSARDREIEMQQNQITQLKKTFSWKITAPVRALAKPFKKSSKDNVLIMNQVEIIKQSGLFDEEWYLKTYPDVAENVMDPVEHYVRHGAGEGRNPSPKFDTQWYLNIYSDVAEAGINPLLHYVEHGQQEGRSISNP